MSEVYSDGLQGVGMQTIVIFILT